MTAVATSSVPTLADARAAAEVLVAEGAVEVLLYGSVARGDATERSDIDLVAVFADVDYSERRDIKARLEAAAGAAVAWPVQVHVTDLPEWRARTANVSASFEHSISRYAVALAADGVGSQPNWAKMMEKPMNNPEEALQYFKDRVLPKVRALKRKSQASFDETDPAEADAGRELMRLDRMVEVCADSAMTVELCLKALATLHGTHPPSEKALASAGHDIEACLRLVPAEPRRTVERLIRERGLDLASMSSWRVESTYPDDAAVVQASADEWAEDYVWTALAVSEHTLDSIRRAAGESPALTEVENAWRARARVIRMHDIRTGQRTTAD